MHCLVDDRPLRRERGERALHRGPEPMLEDERDEVLLRSRVEEQRPLRDAGAIGDGRGRRAVEAALDEERLRRLADARELVVLVGLPTHEI